MKRFRFRLETVLKVRQLELDRARAQLAAAEREMAVRTTKWRETRDRARRGEALLREETQQGADGERLALRALGEMMGRADLRRAERAILAFQPALTNARAIVQAAHTRLRSLERLKDKQQEAHRVAGLALEQAQLEEISMQRVARETTGARFDAAEGEA